jgi:Bifunctional DNA primase/polymerase, N-terminal
MSSNVLDAARKMIEMGCYVVPIRSRSKVPLLANWPNLRLRPQDLALHFSNGSNLGLLTGVPSHFIADVDLDWPEAVIAARFVRGPATERVCGHESNPESHYFFSVGTEFKNQKFLMPGCGKPILELRGTGHQTVIPPSLHEPTGEPIMWHREGEFGKTTEDALLQWSRKLAAAALLARRWPRQGKHHDGVFALAGVLHRAHWTVADAVEFVLAAAQAAGDDKKLRNRERDVRTTFRRLGSGKSATGVPTAIELFGEKTISAVYEWLRLVDNLSPKTPTNVICKPVAPEWPKPMESQAFCGVAGDFVRLMEPNTEADPTALLANFLVCCGWLFGREAWAIADGKKHYPVEFALTTGATGSGRKGTATGRVREVLEGVDPFFSACVLSGLSSGEGLIKGVSATDGRTEVRRYLAVLPEFASLLSVMTRQGNTMSAVLREAWDCERLRVLTRKETLDADNVNISVIAHVTREELLNNLTATDRANGFANRFLILLVRRSKFLPEGADEVNLRGITSRLHEAMAKAKGRGLIQRDASARELWCNEYPRLTSGYDGLRGALCGRAEAHVLRLSLLYALLDSSGLIRSEHLEAALAFWDYCARSVDTIFGVSSGDPEENKILAALKDGPMTMSDLHRVFGNNRDPDWIRGKISKLVRSGRLVQTMKDGNAKKAIPAWELKE